jgi:hypothetical protein
MNFSSFVVSILFVLGLGCGDGDRAPIDAATRRDASAAGSDGGTPRDAGRPPDGAIDTGTASGDAATPADGGAAGLCDPVCLAMPGAACCTMCGCEARVRCTPVCPAPFRWDCEVGCCFDDELLRCVN